MKKLLIFVNITLAVLLIYEMTRSYQLSSEPVSTEPLSLSLPNIIDSTAQSILSLLDYSEIIERPLFSQDRKPYTPEPILPEIEPVAEDIQEEQSVSSNFKLFAVVLTDETKKALISINNSANIEHVALGEELNGWQITEIQANRVTLNQGGEKLILELVVQTTVESTTNDVESQDESNDSEN